MGIFFCGAPVDDERRVRTDSFVGSTYALTASWLLGH